MKSAWCPESCPWFVCDCPLMSIVDCWHGIVWNKVFSALFLFVSQCCNNQAFCAPCLPSSIPSIAASTPDTRSEKPRPLPKIQTATLNLKVFLELNDLLPSETHIHLSSSLAVFSGARSSLSFLDSFASFVSLTKFIKFVYVFKFIKHRFSASVLRLAVAVHSAPPL